MTKKESVKRKEEMFEILEKAAKAGGQIVRENFNKEIKKTWKGKLKTDIVTEADIKSQEAIVKILNEAMIEKGIDEEEIGFITEEDYQKPGNYKFIIDPLDGTSDFAFGIERFAVSIGFMENGEVTAGIIYDPMRDITYFAEKEKGSYKITKGSKTKLGILEKELEESLISFNSSSKKEKSIEMFERAIRITPDVLRVREQGAVTLALMAVVENKFQCHLNGRCRIWDIAAAKLIIEEAGGIMLDFRGEEVGYDLENTGKGYEIVAGNKNLVKKVLKYL